MVFCAKYIAIGVIVAAVAINGAVAGSIDDIEHIVVFMQENRAYDHYYGTLRGVRGFNDRAAPPLPDGRPIFYQPAGPPPSNATALCGCGGCNIAWTEQGGGEIRALLQTLTCTELVGALQGANPPVSVANGEKCATLIDAMAGSSLEHMPFSEFMNASLSSCPAGLSVTGVPSAAEVIVEPRHTENDADDDGSAYILPFNLQFDKTAATCMPAPEMAYASDINIFNGGLMDAWNTARAPGFGMSYFDRHDLPYYYWLADHFTIGDQYFQSTFTATCPNREHLFSGSQGLSVGGKFSMLDDSEPKPGFDWETMAETLEAADISWGVIQQKDNFDDNGFAWFETFQNAKPGDWRYEKGIRPIEDLETTFANLVGNKTLPQVTWIVGPAALSEHAENHPADGEDLSARLISVLGRPENADMYAKTAFILNYDEGGQFVDHHWPPTPPTGRGNDGKSTVAVTGELTEAVRFGIAEGNPIGFGFRVPLFIVSPWTRGGYVYSEVADHTSVIKFIERRFGVHCPNISPWRRAVAGDLTAAFNWDHPDYSWPSGAPSTAANVNQSKWECDHLPAPTLPTQQSMPTQEAGTRMAMPLPYKFNVTAAVVPPDSAAGTAGNVTLTIANVGKQGAAFQVFNLVAPTAQPRKYTVEAGKALDDVWMAGTLTRGKYNLSCHGPNGFVVKASGDAATAAPSATIAYDTGPETVAIVTSVAAGASGSCAFSVVDNAYGAGPWSVPAVAPGASAMQVVDVSASAAWYDLTIVSVPSPACPGSFSRRFQGHMEIPGKITTTDPAMAVPRADDAEHPPVPEAYRTVEKFTVAKDCASRRSRLKDHCWRFGPEAAMHSERDALEFAEL